MTKKLILALQGMSVATSFAYTHTVYAAGSSTCGGDALGSLFCDGDLSRMFNIAFQTSILVGAVLAMLRIGYAGYLYMGSSDMWSNKTHAKEVFQDAIIGLLILLAIYMILFQINPDILKLTALQG